MMETFPQSIGSGQSYSFVTVTKGRWISVESSAVRKATLLWLLPASSTQRQTVPEQETPEECQTAQGSPLSSSRGLILTRRVQTFLCVMTTHNGFQSQNQQVPGCSGTEDFVISTLSGRQKSTVRLFTFLLENSLRTWIKEEVWFIWHFILYSIVYIWFWNWYFRWFLDRPDCVTSVTQFPKTSISLKTDREL